MEPGPGPAVVTACPLLEEDIGCPPFSPSLLPILMLFASNVFMTFAWYGHLKFKERSLPLVIMVSWGIAFFEYWLAVPANRWGSAVYSAAQLKTMQEVITLVVFAGFSVLYLKEPLGWNHGLGFAYRRRRVLHLPQMVWTLTVFFTRRVHRPRVRSPCVRSRTG